MPSRSDEAVTMSHLRVTVVDGLGRPATSALARWLARAAPGAARGAVTIALVSDATMCRLNRDFRGIDAATDVLSFPAGRQGPRRARNGGRKQLKSLGDIAIATGVARRQARRCRHSTATELRV